MSTVEKGDILLVLASLFILLVVGILIFRVPENKISLLGATESKNGELTYLFTDNQGNSVERRHGYL